jgi:predicted metal-dependent hydrolase
MSGIENLEAARFERSSRRDPAGQEEADMTPTNPALGERPLQARPFRFDFSATPLQWLPSSPFASHLISVLHLIAPVGERRFVKVMQHALPGVDDPRLRAEMRGFIGQEAVHAHVHDAVLARMAGLGVECAPFIARCELAYDTAAGERRPGWAPARLWLGWRLAYAAAAEQMTCLLGDWVLDARPLDAPGTDAEMASFLRWHGAEEIEHRAVTFEVLERVAGPVAYPLRVLAMLTLFPTLVTLWHQGTRYLTERDPALAGRRFGFADYLEAVKTGHAPGWEVLGAFGRFLLPGFHPVHEGRAAVAEAFMATAPAR